MSNFEKASVRVAQVAVIIAIAAAPWPFGSVLAQVYRWYFVVAAVALCAVFAAGRTQARYGPGGIVSIGIMALVLGAFQLIPLPPNILTQLAPTAATLRGDAAHHADASAAASAEASSKGKANHHPTWSVYPHETRHTLALLSLTLCFWFLGGALFHSAQERRLLFACVLGIGCAVALFAFIQRLSWNGLIYWQYSFPMRSEPFGPFINRNNAAGYLNICLAAALYCIALMAQPQSDQDEQSRAASHLLTNWLSIPQGWRLLANPLVHVSLFASILIAAAVLASKSRGGILALAVGLVAIVLVPKQLKTKLKIWTVAAVLVCALGGIAVLQWLNLQSGTTERLQTLLDFQQLKNELRILHWQDGAEAAQAFFPGGSGFGTYRYAYKPFETKPLHVWFMHAENIYLETLVEGGIAAALLLVAAILLIVIAAFRLLRSSSVDSIASGVALAFLLATQGLQAGLDLGVYVPANMLLMALLGGSLTSAITLDQQIAATPGTKRRLAGRVIAQVVTTSFGVLMLWGWWQSNQYMKVENAIRSSPATGRRAISSMNELDSSIKQIERAIHSSQDSAEAHQHAAALWLRRFTISARQLEPPAQVEGANQNLVRFRELFPVAVYALELAQSGETESLKQIQSHPIVVANLRPAFEHLMNANSNCSMIADVHLRLAMLAFLTDDPVTAAKLHLNRTVLLAPSDHRGLYQAGLMYLAVGAKQQAYSAFRQSWQLAPDRMEKPILALYQTAIASDDFVEHVVPKSPLIIARLLDEGFKQERFAQLRLVLAEQLLSMLPSSELARATKEYLQATALLITGKTYEAIAHLEIAVVLDPNHEKWHHTLARMLVTRRRWQQAHKHAKMAARLSSDPKKYRELLRTIERELP